MKNKTTRKKIDRIVGGALKATKNAYPNCYNTQYFTSLKKRIFGQLYGHFANDNPPMTPIKKYINRNTQ